MAYKYGRGAPPLSPVSDGTVELELGVPDMEQRRIHVDEPNRAREAMNPRHSVNFPPIRYLGENEKLLLGEAGQRLLHSIQVKTGENSPDSKWSRIDAIPARLGVHTSTENMPVAWRTSPGTKLTSVPNIDVPIQISNAKYEWDRPMPPAPPRRDLPIIWTEHDRYYHYYKKAKEEQRKQEAVILPTITPTQPETFGAVPSLASGQQSPRELELKLPPITTGIVTKG